MSALILDLAAAADPVLVGGKGHALGRLTRYGFAVPAGFVLTTAAFAQAESLDLAALLAGELERRGWEATPLAVRSSAPMEDSQRASFAGIHHSALNVVGPDAVAAAVRAVWASLWTPQATAYRERLGIEEAAMAVVVMPMLPAVAAGVAFSCDPASGRDDRVLINAVAGLADALVAGAVSGEEIVLATDPISEDYAVIGRSGPACGLGTPACGLSDAQAVELAELVRETAFCLDYGSPFYDVEWVWDGERFHVVQARPVTARRWHTYPALAGQPALWSNGNTRDALPHVMNACDWAFSRRLVNLLLEPGWRLAGYALLPGAQRAALFNGRLYLNAALLQWECFDAVGIVPAATNRLLGGHHADIAVPPATRRERLARAGRMLRYLAKSGRLRRRGRRQIESAHAACAGWRGENLAALSADELVQRYFALGLHCRRQDGLLFLQGSSGGSLSLLLDVIDRWLPGEGHALAAALLAGGEPSVTARQGYELQALAALAAADPETADWLRQGGEDWQRLPSDHAFRRAFADFIDRYGHRGIYESYARNPRWREDPGYLLRQIAGLIDREPAAVAARQQAVRQAARERLRRHLPFWARRLVESLARAATVECNDREAARSAFIAYGEVGRLLLLEVGRRLAARGCLQRAEQAFHLLPPEVAAALAGRLHGDALRHRIADRERLVAEWDANPAPEVVAEGAAATASAPAEVRAESHPGDGWHGTAVGAGVAAGPARIVRHPEESERLAAGDILVAPSTDPAWTPLFLKAGGLVMETGGYLSHGAIVAREFGIPAVVNLPGILAALADGEPVEVDGGRGRVRRISR